MTRMAAILMLAVLNGCVNSEDKFLIRVEGNSSRKSGALSG
jgi:hypothetical protein